jgi:hypothetical protein
MLELTFVSTSGRSWRMRLERINLDVPVETRQRLRAVAKRLNKTESEVARDLLVDALRRKKLRLILDL